MDKFSKDVWINAETGERIEATRVLKRLARDDFEITYIAYLLDIFDRLGGKKYAVLKYIMKHRSLDNTLIITIEELCKATSVSRQTCLDALRLLEDAHLIQRRTGAIILNPRVLNRGSKQKELYLLQKFETFDQEPPKA